jgi:hypothetical protein
MITIKLLNTEIPELIKSIYLMRTKQKRGLIRFRGVGEAAKTIQRKKSGSILSL